MEKSKYLKRIYGKNNAFLKRKCKPPFSLDDGKEQPEFPKAPYVHYRSMYMETIDNVINHTKDQFNEVFTIVKLFLVMPAANSASERSFSALRRVKTYLRNRNA